MSQDASDRVTVREQGPVRTTTGSAHHADIDWESAENSPEFKELIAKKRKFVLPATIFFLAWYTIFILLAGYAEGFMGTRVVGGLTVGYLLALTQFIMVWGLSLAYLRKADRDFEPLEQRAAQRAMEGFGRTRGDSTGLAGRGDGAGAWTTDPTGSR
jgi:uncharacterized membrane protein (DUF485 family)